MEITKITKEEFDESERIPKPPLPNNPVFTKIQNVLDYKKQVILYGPPGTGKTWIANNFIK